MPKEARAIPSGYAAVGKRVQVWWNDDQQWYGGRVQRFDNKSGKHLLVYDDDDTEWLDLEKEHRKNHLVLGSCAGGPERKNDNTVVGLVTAGAQAGKRGQDKCGYGDVGKRCDAWWNFDKQWYAGQVQRFDCKSGQHLICYDDGDEEWLDLGLERSKRRVILSDRWNGQRMLPCPRCMLKGQFSNFCLSQGHQGLVQGDEAGAKGGRKGVTTPQTASPSCVRSAGDRHKDERAIDQVAPGPESVGKRVSVYWPGEDAWFDGLVTRYVAVKKSRKRHYIQYDDDDGNEWRDLSR